MENTSGSPGAPRGVSEPEQSLPWGWGGFLVLQLLPGLGAQWDHHPQEQILVISWRNGLREQETTALEQSELWAGFCWD